MSEQLTQSPEQSTPTEIPEVPKSRELYSGDINDAVISAQRITGTNISPEWWASEVGNDGSSEDILDRFDKAYERYVWRMNKVPEEQIITLQSHEDAPDSAGDNPVQINGINIPAKIERSNADQDALPRAALEMIAKTRATTDTLQPPVESPPPSPEFATEPTIEALNPTFASTIDIDTFRAEAIRDFTEQIGLQDDDLYTEFMYALDEYLDSLERYQEQQTSYDLAG